MAEKEEDKTGLTTKIDFRKAFAKNKWENKEEFDIVSKIRDRFDEMKMARENSCPWAKPPTLGQLSGDDSDEYSDETKDDIESGDVGTNWADHFDKCYKAWNMYKTYDISPNLKSPTTFAPVEAAMGEFKENAIGVTLSSFSEEDDEKVKIIEESLKYVDRQGDFGKEKSTSLKECIITGTSFDYIGWVSRDRDVEIVMNSRDIEKEIKKANKKRKKELQEILDKKLPITEKKRISEYNDIAYIPVSIYEIYPDPDARCLHGTSYEATDLIWRNVMSLDQFKAEYINSHDPYLKRNNLDKVVSAKRAQADYDCETPFFNTPHDIASDNQVEVIRYYNKQTDKYIIIANDVLVRDGILPYNHKEIPFVQHKFIKFPHQFYGIGMATVLESLQAEDEALMNTELHLAYLAGNPAMIVNQNIANDVDEQVDYLEAGKVIHVSGETNESNIRWFSGPQTPLAEFTTLRNTIEQNAVKVSGVNPMAYAQPRANEPVRNNMMAMESTLKSLKKGFKNWAEGQKDAVRQEIAIMKQMYTKEKLIRIEGKEIYEENKKLKEQRIEGVSWFKLKPEYFDLKAEPDIEISIDTLVPMSQSQKMTTAQTALRELTPVLANPQLMIAPGMSVVLRDFIEAYQLNPRLLDILKDASSPQEVDDAMKQEALIEQGNKLEGIHGESESHKMQHLSTFLEWDNKLRSMEKAEASKPLPPPQMDMYGQIIPQAPPKPPQALLEIQDRVKRLFDHMETDNMPKSAYMDTVVKKMTVNEQALQQNPMLPPGMPPGMPAGPQGGGMPPGMPQGMMPGVPQGNPILAGAGLPPQGVPPAMGGQAGPPPGMEMM